MSYITYDILYLYNSVDNNDVRMIYLKSVKCR